MAERMFDQDSFLEEIQTPADARACVDYLAHNEHQFLEELRNEGLSYEERQEALRQVWTNLIKSAQRVGYFDHLLENKAKQFGVGVNRALPYFKGKK